MPKWFGTDGIRGESYVYPLTPEIFRNLGFHFGHHIRSSGHSTCLVGRDTRKSGTDLLNALIEGLLQAGIRVLNADVFPTPAVIYIAADEGIHAAVVTASHNPYPDNGLKLITPQGRKIPETVEEELERLMNTPPERTSHPPGEHVDARAFARERYLKLIDAHFQHLKGSRIQVVLDVARGAAFELVPHVFDHLEIPHTVLFNDPDGENINEGCGAVHPEALKLKINEITSSDSIPTFGFAFDGDGDRVMTVLPNEGIWDGQYLLAMAALAHRERLGSRTAVVSTVMANQGLEQFLRDHAIELIRTPVGDRHIADALDRHDLTFGAEPSGHFINRHCSPTGDGCLTALMALDIFLNRPEAVESVRQGYRPFPQVLKNVRIPYRRPLEELAELNRRVAFHRARLGSHGRIYLRYSGTEPVLRILVEADTPVIAGRVAEDLVDAAERDFRKVPVTRSESQPPGVR